LKTGDYIHGARHGREAHDLELEAMRDPLLGDALDGFDAVPGDHSAALGRLAEGIRDSAAQGRAAARSRSARLRERRVRGWSVAAAAVFLAGVVGGGAWLFREGVPPTSTRGPIANRTYSSEEAEAILPPVTVIPNEPTPVSPPTDISDLKFDREEMRDFSDALAAEVSAEASEETIAGEIAEAPARDTTVTAAFRRYIHDRTIVRSAVLGAVTLRFDVDADGRPQNISVVSAPANFPGAADTAVELLKNGPDWPREPRQKLITINL
jgi:hypothetical protein